MTDIEAENAKRVARLNFYKSENESKNIRGSRGDEANNTAGENHKHKKESILPKTVKEVNTKDGKKKKRQVVDDFFVQEEEESDEEQNEEMQ
jgi:hypothetical protein